MSENAQIYAIDDDEAVLKSLEFFFRQRGIPLKSFPSAASFMAEVPLSSPGCVVLDLQMPDINGLEFQRQLTVARSPLSIVVVTGIADVQTAVRVMEQGAVTLLEKPYDHEELLSAVQLGLEASRKRMLKRQDEELIRDRIRLLSEEERQVLTCMLAGDPNKQIASALHLSMRTVDRRRQAVLDKMGARTVPELALMIGSVDTHISAGVLPTPTAEPPAS